MDPSAIADYLFLLLVRLGIPCWPVHDDAGKVAPLEAGEYAAVEQVAQEASRLESGVEIVALVVRRFADSGSARLLGVASTVGPALAARIRAQRGTTERPD